MREQVKKGKKGGGRSLLLAIFLIFCAFGAVVYAVSQKISRETGR